MTALNKLFIYMALMFAAGISACSPKGGLFGKKSPHDQYARKLSDAGLDKTALGMSWFTAALNAINRPLAITIPYKEIGYFPSEIPSAAGLSFSAKKGELISVELTLNPARSLNMFIDLWHKSGNDDPQFLSATDTSSLVFKYEVDDDGTYLVRLQPELLRGVQYTITISTGPSLAFPVRSSDQPRTSSFWGAERVGGSRSHEGIDIFAKRGTPAIAIADGRVTRVNENQLGGKVVFMQPTGKNYNLYYAHLDSQIVKEGDRVKVGDVIGLIGNTGNARTTPPHLHFGIYTRGGAVDPFPFVNADRPKLPDVSVDVLSLNQIARTISTSKVLTSLPDKSSIYTLPPNTVVRLQAGTGNYYKITTPDGLEGFMNASNIINKPVRTITTRSLQPLYDKPDSASAIIKMIEPGKNITIQGTFNGYQYVEENNTAGWLVTEN